MRKQEVLHRLIQYVDHSKLLIPISFILAAVSVMSALYVPIAIGHAIDMMLGQGRVFFAGLHIYAIRIVFSACLSGLSSWLMDLVNNHIVYRTVREIRDDLMAKIHHLPLSYLDRHPAGDLAGRVITDVQQLGDGLLLGTQQLCKGLLTIMCTLAVMLYHSFILTILILFLTPLSFLTAKFIAGHTYHMFQKQNETRGGQTAFLQEAVLHQKVLCSYDGWQASQKEFDAWNQKLQGYSEKAVFYSSLTNPCTRAVNNIIYAVTAFAGIFCIRGGTLTVGGLSMMLSYANQYMKPFNEISSVITEFQNALSCADRIFAVLDQVEESDEGQVKHRSWQGAIQVEDVSFSYNKEGWMEHLTVEIPKGKKVALVGATGCGKTTFMNLIMRFYEVQKGRILLDGVNLRDIKREELSSIFGMVLQDTWLKDGTIRDNITFGKEADDAAVIEACKKAHSWEFIKRLPHQLDEFVDESTLSQGEKQLLCMTRVMLMQPPVLILDEATSSIDVYTEQKVQDAFDTMMKGHTCIIAAHRLKTIENADIILVMEDGKIVEKGTHECLLKENGAYKKLYDAQFAIEK